MKTLRPRLSRAQYRFFASAIKTIAEAIIIGTSAALFLPETFQLTQPISAFRYILLISIGLLFLVSGAILEKKGEA